MLCAAWEMAVPLTPAVWHGVLTIAGFVAITSPIQDFRDIAGDRVMGRKTLPIAWRERRLVRRVPGYIYRNRRLPPDCRWLA